jgi:diaminopimelate decarboxylase
MTNDYEFDNTFLPDEALAQLAKTLPTPFYLYNEAGIRAACRQLRDAFAWEPGFRQFFPVKALPNGAILRLLREEGMGVVCSSMPELELVRRCGFSGDEILFAANYPLAEDIAMAAQLHTGVILDGTCVLDDYAAAGCLPEVVGLRYNPGGAFQVGMQSISRQDKMKFGFTRQQIYDAIPRLQAAGVRAIGLHGYMGGNVTLPGYYEAVARLLFQLAADLHRDTGVEIAFVNISGGLGLAYRDNETAPDLLEEAQRVQQAYNELLVPADLGQVQVHTELGRYLTGPHGILVSRVRYIKETYRTYLGLDACAANLMRPMLYDAYHHISLVGKHQRLGREKYEIVGGVPENTDRMSHDARLLPHAEVGDLVVIHDVGAHGHSMGYNYAGKLRSAEYLYQTDGTVRMIRRAETAEDYLQTQILD